MNSLTKETTAPVTVTEITDPSEANDGIELLDLDAVQLHTGAMRAHRVVVRAGTTAIVLNTANVRLRTRTKCSEGLVAYVAFGPGAAGTVNGMPVRPDQLLTAGLGAEVGFVVEPGWESITFLLPAMDLDAHLSIRKRPGLLPPPGEAVMLSVTPDVVSELFAWGRQLAETAAMQPAVFNDDERMLAALRIEILEKLLATIGVAQIFEPSRSDRTRQRRSRIVKLAEQYVLEHNGANLYVTDLCRIAGVSERALEYAFKEVIGLTPVAFLAKLRLHRVRQALIAATSESTTVANEALRWGFWHLGEFSRAYSKCFGELPSETLERHRDRAKNGEAPVLITSLNAHTPN